MSPAALALPWALLAGLLLAPPAAEAHGTSTESPPPGSKPAEPPPPPPPPAERTVERTVYGPLHTLTLGVEVHRGEGGASNNLYGSLELSRLGLFARASELRLSAGEGTQGNARIRLAGAHLSWALVTLPMLRLRAEAGASYAQAPLVSLLGPSLGASGELHLLGLVALEARAQLTPLPYRQLDAAAGVAVYLGPLALRAGQRLLVLDDAGLVDGVAHQGMLTGPYLSAGLAF